VGRLLVFEEASVARSNRTAGIEIRHKKSCPSREGGFCLCDPSYRAQVWSPSDGRFVRRTFRNLTQAIVWRDDARVEIRRGLLRASSPVTIGEAAPDWLEGARAGRIRNRSGDVYKPSSLRGYEESLRLRLLPAFGGTRLDRLARVDLQDLVEDMLGEGLEPSTIRNTLMPLRAIYRRAISRGEVTVNPTRGLELPAVRGRRDRIASPAEAASLLAALDYDRALWATAMYAGLRRGELQGLRIEDIDLRRGVINVRHTWDPVAGPLNPKSRSGVRVVPIPARLKATLAEHLLGLEWSGGLAFGRSQERPFSPKTIHARARRAWVDLEPLTLHECRHTYASLMIAAGVNAKALSTYMGHASVVITYDLYGHLMPGNEAEAAQLLDALLDRA
jgi:integrase